jgi:X-X-X-Leu-X-X-Gly heptad repeat protein
MPTNELPIAVTVKGFDTAKSGLATLATGIGQVKARGRGGFQHWAP